MRDCASLTRRATFAPASFDPEAMTVEVVWTTGARVRRVDAAGFSYDEDLEVTTRAVDLSRLNAGAPLLDAHQQAGLDRLLGVVDRAWIEAGQGRAVVRFSERAAAIAADVRAGIIRNISVGYVVSEWAEVTPKGATVPVMRAVRWQPYELSLVPVPADAAAQVRGAASVDAPAQPHEVNMSDTETEMAADRANADTVSPLAERRRAAELANVATLAGLGADWVARHIEAGTPLARARDEAIDALAARSPRMPVRAVVDPLLSGGESPEGVAVEYFTARLVGRAPKGPAEQFRGMRALDVLADHARQTRGLTIRPGTPPSDMLRMLTTSDVPLLTQSAANRAMVELYPAVRTQLLQAARRIDLPDFRPQTLIRLAQHNPLDKVVQGGEVTAQYPTETGETIALDDYANSFPMTERVWINDDMQAIAAWLGAAAQAAATRERLLLAGLLTAGSGVGPTLSDGHPWFHATRGNIAVSAALDVTSLGAAVAAMRALKDNAGQTVYGLEPGFIVVSPALEMKARQLVADLETVSARSDVQPWRLDVIVEPALSGNRWWLAPTAASRLSLAVGYLGGQEVPRVEQFTHPDVLGVTVRVTHRLAAAVQDPIGWVTNAGG